MFDPHDDTDVPSGSTDGAQMESTSSPVHRLQAWVLHIASDAFVRRSQLNFAEHCRKLAGMTLFPPRHPLVSGAAALL